MITALLMSLLTTLSGVAGDEEFTQGMAAYEAERFEEARMHFETALERPQASRGPLLYNLGHCAFRLGDPTRAIVYYTAAIRRMPLEQAPVRDRNLARRELGLEALDPEPPGPFARFDTLSGGTRLAIVGGLQFLALWMFLLARARARFVLVPILAIAVTGAFHLVRSTYERPAFPGIVVTDDAAIRSEPHANLAVLFELGPGEVVRVDEYSTRWVRITHPRGSGWVERASVDWVE